MFLSLFTSSDVTVFVVCMMSSCFDFWIVKNITGRFLIGLRWWSASDLLEEDLKEGSTKQIHNENSDGSEDESEEEEGLMEEWYFESYDHDINTSPVDSSVFWWSQVSITIYWMIFLVIKAISLSIFWVSISTCLLLPFLGNACLYLLQSQFRQPLRLLQVFKEP